MASEVLGRNAALYVIADATLGGSGTPAKLAKMTDLSISANADEIDVTTFDDAGLRNYVKGSRDLTVDFSFIFEDAATTTAQRDIIKSWNNYAADNSSPNAAGTLEFNIILADDMSINGFLFITSLSISTGADDVQRIDCSARCLGVSDTAEWDFIG
jgi:predicted secreted protein